ncbi:MAG: efflux RND transporter periplasmic adaptor subunit [Bacillota bacterium]|nr:efflux RND transporter periplasmic adaptor subunit [Bacillota bacterium]
MITKMKEYIKLKFRNKIFRFAAAAVALVLIVVILAGFNVIKFTGSNVQNQLRTAAASKGDITLTVTGSGPITASNKYEISPVVNSKITKVYHKQGDTVKAGELLFELDNTDASLEMERMQNSVATTQLQLNNLVSQVDSLTLTAPFSGYVSGILVKQGDMVGKNAGVLTLANNSEMELLLPFNSADAKSIHIGDMADINVPGFMQTISGTVSGVDTVAYVSNNGGQLCNVDILISNPGSLSDGAAANAEVETGSGVVSSTDNGTLKSNNSISVRSLSGGTVKKVNVKENQWVNKGDVLAVFDNSDLLQNETSTQTQMESLEAQTQSIQKQLQNYKLYAPIDGTIITQDSTTAKVGSTVTQGESLCTLEDSGHMQFTVDVDELDISKVKTGQKVNVTIDALTDTESNPLSGTVTQAALEGTSSNGVATYPVIVTVENTNGLLKGGMNANATIIIDNKSNILTVPIEAVQTYKGKSYVMIRQEAVGSTAAGIKTDQSIINRLSNSQYYINANAVPKQVELGVNNESYIELKSGLNEGDMVILPPLAEAQSSSKTQSSQNSSNNNNSSGMMMDAAGGDGPPPDGDPGGGPGGN